MPNTQPEKLIALIRNDMRQAMKDRESVRLGALRSLLARISNAEAVAPQEDDGDTGEGPIAGATQGVGSTERRRKQLTLDDVHTVIRGEIDEIGVALEGVKAGSTYGAELREKRAIIQKYV